ncbi:uncharacterized protein LOC133198052 [Saccostrea echinata]|uniref:uncharacterized protein LOC133198052 n=1 Tax=Saccostrea echinata TaxID=191078 RepID=UPI002A7F9DA2|nr:uncharacterized protein LOC133198052 [Saccostrea echinata]
MNHLPRLSEAVYVGLCREVGSPTEVRMRREVMDTVEVVRNSVRMKRGLHTMKSGSRGEGFRMRSSDLDYMFWYPNHKVICDLSQISLYRIPQQSMILMECDDLPNGFTRLNLLSPSCFAKVISSCVVMNNKVCISSILFRDKHLQLLKTSNIAVTSVFPHGPCSTHSEFQGLEIDYVFCLRSHHWPKNALPWIQRCREQGWPVGNVLSDILREGFHVVPIGSKPENGLEWRISFSLAEQKLTHSMNHCQFLCYGLLKFFLKEVINCQTKTSILCSYFIKSVVFWVIQSNTFVIWTPDNLLYCFWECFKLLISWVHTGVCPNFFIPQNNMFRLKVTGSAQTSLFRQLYDLYCKGISCLLLSETVRPYLSIAISNRTLRACLDESSIISSIKLDINLFKELSVLNIETKRADDFAVYMKLIERMPRRGLTEYQTVTLQYLSSIVLRNTAMFLQSSIYQNENSNRASYKGNKVSALLKQSCTFGCLSDILYLAMYFYRNRRYEDSLRCLHIAQQRMSLPYITYWDHVNVDVYGHCMVRNTLGTKIRRALVEDIALYMEYTYFDELVLEQEIGRNNERSLLLIPPIVMLHMLLFLNHHRLGDTIRSQQSLLDLQALLLRDVGVHIPREFRDVSWQILGICKQICGDYSGSLQSYQYSLQQEPFHRIQKATLLRINTLPHVAI